MKILVLISEIRKQAVLTAYGYKDSEIIRKYFNDVLNWQNGQLKVE